MRQPVLSRCPHLALLMRIRRQAVEGRDMVGDGVHSRLRPSLPKVGIRVLRHEHAFKCVTPAAYVVTLCPVT